MIPGLQLRQFRLGGDWRPLLQLLGGWRSLTPNTLSDGDSQITLCEGNVVEPEVGFVSQQSRDVSIAGPVKVFSSRHSSLAFKVSPRQFPSAHPAGQRRYLMNHAAFQVPNIDAERMWLEELLGACTVLARDLTWDPVARMSWPDAHLFRPPDFYLTLRGGFERAQVDHVGWMTNSREAVDESASFLEKLRWPMLFGPEYLDGSYLVHFRGPDLRVHDFFFPTEAIVPKETQQDAT